MSTAITAAPPHTDPAGQEQDRYADVHELLTQWLAPVLAAKLTGEGRGKTWCAQWWRHRDRNEYGADHPAGRGLEAAEQDGFAAVNGFPTTR